MNHINIADKKLQPKLLDNQIIRVFQVCKDGGERELVSGWTPARPRPCPGPRPRPGPPGPRGGLARRQSTLIPRTR